MLKKSVKGRGNRNVFRGGPLPPKKGWKAQGQTTLITPTPNSLQLKNNCSELCKYHWRSRAGTSSPSSRAHRSSRPICCLLRYTLNSILSEPTTST